MMDADGETRGAKTHAALIARGKALVSTEPNYARFLLYTIRATDPDDLGPHSAAMIDAELRRSYALLEKRGSAGYFINVSAADVLVLDAPEIIDIFTPDMPFIVDSVLAAIRAKGGRIRLVSHPVLPLDPASYRVLNEPTPQSRQESFLHLHLDPLPDDATREAVLAEVREVLDEVALAVRGWRPMLERLRQHVQDVRENAPHADPALITEAIQFLGWLAGHNFTFLGMREYHLVNEGGGETRIDALPGSGIGLLENPGVLFLRQGRDFVESTPEHAEFLAGPEPIHVSKANVKSRVHRRAYMDYVGVKLFDGQGEVSGELRIVGLFTSSSAAVPNADVPLLRRKLEKVLEQSGAVPSGHTGKALLHTLETYPRDELFQIDIPTLFEFSTAIATLIDRPRVRVLPRIDRFDNFVSVLVYLPRDGYTSDLRSRVGAYLADRYEGRVSTYYPHFPEEGELVRVHFIIGRDGGPTPRPDRDDLERDVLALTRNFGDRLLAAAPNASEIEPFAAAFPAAYQAGATAAQALADIAIFRALGNDAGLHLLPAMGSDAAPVLKVYHRNTPVPLSDRVPLLENFGFRVIDETTHRITPVGEPDCYLHDMVLALPEGVQLGDGVSVARLEEALLAVWHGTAENDPFNQLVLRARLSWEAVALLRALGRYLRQVGFSFSQRYLAATLTAHPGAASALIELFHALHAPDFVGDRDAAEANARTAIATALEETASLDEDRIIRRVLNLVDASVRTNYYQRDALGARRPALGIKFDCAKVAEMPAPHPFREIFVYSPRVEGLHLRFGPVARGGIRWSDRPEDFRTEVLGLVKAQQVKNAIIVPVGAKGAFVPKTMPAGANRDAVQAEGIACYRIFISTLLDLTDNIEAGAVSPPPNLRALDAADPYLVVAADKGTASFSDIANALATGRGYWLGDAFASGGSAGYDHKAMGITARGAWESVKRHFNEMGRDIQREPFTVAGVGDMSGDVFGNGMLQSPKTRLVAAFDHRDIFIDPDPDPVLSFAERQRLFALPRSSWQDYNRAILSRGGAIFSRSLKHIALEPEARLALGLVDGDLAPQDVINAILRADVDLLWFGGIGTYVRGSGETDAQVGDRSNDAVRITGRDIRARVVGEGANLGMTQLGRIEYARRGGRLNTDAIDNSAGVNASDLEVNIKIALGPEVTAGRMTVAQRNELLAAMTDEVAGLCLRNNYLQPLTLSLEQHGGAGRFPEHRALLKHLEARGQLDRTVELLPDDATLDARAAEGAGFTRPELAVLLAYAKNSLNADLVASGVPDDPYLGRELFAYFPLRLAQEQRDAIEHHRLRREVIATVLANAMLNQGGPGYVVAMMEATSADAAAVTAAYAAVRDTYGLPELDRAVDALDHSVSATTQLSLYRDVADLLTTQTLWFLRNETFEGGLSELVARYTLGVSELREGLAGLLPESLAVAIASRTAALVGEGVPVELARRFAELPALALASDIVLVATRTGSPVLAAAAALLRVVDTFGLTRVADGAQTLDPADRFDRMALDRALANLHRAERDLATDVLSSGDGPIEDRFAGWHDARAAAIDRAARAVAELTEGGLTISRLAVAVGLLSDLARQT